MNFKISLFPNGKFNLIYIDKTIEDVEKIENYLLNLIYPKSTHMDFNISAVLHYGSLGEGIDSNGKKIKSGAKVIKYILIIEFN